jgi:hypothetical protein
MMLDYTAKTGPIVRGGRWPSGGGAVYIGLTPNRKGNVGSWPAGVTSWTWQLILSENKYGGLPSITVTPHSVSLSGNTLKLVFYVSEDRTAIFTGTDKIRLWAQIRSINGNARCYYATGRAVLESNVAQE